MTIGICSDSFLDIDLKTYIIMFFMTGRISKFDFLKTSMGFIYVGCYFNAVYSSAESHIQLCESAEERRYAGISEKGRIKLKFILSNVVHLGEQ